jgi:hypothetical protein
MSKGVSKHCSILNYIRHNDEALFELVQDLCIGKIFMPRKGSPGITFLHPSGDLLKKIQTMAAGDEPEKAIESIQSLVLLDNLPSIQDFEDKKSDIPTYLRKKLPVKSVESKKVVLSNGAEITLDTNFQSRNDRSNISVYNISGALVPTDGPAADFSNAKIKSVKKGGADLTGCNRRTIFELVLNSHVNNNSDPAMELMVALHNWAIKGDQKDTDAAKNLAELIESQASYDTLASLACVIQPYKTSNHYISDQTLSQAFTAIMGGDVGLDAVRAEFKKETNRFTHDVNALNKYTSFVNSTKYSEIVKYMQSAQQGVVANMGKTNAVSLLTRFFHDLDEKILAGLPDIRKPVRPLMYAEAELRVMSAVVQENSNGQPDLDDLKGIFQKCSLDRVYMCADKELISSANIGFYYSTVYLMARSDALLYVPGYSGSSVDILTDENNDDMISLNVTFKDLSATRRAKSDKELSKPVSEF